MADELSRPCPLYSPLTPSPLIHSTSLLTRERKNRERFQRGPQIRSQERHRFRRDQPRKGLNLATVRPIEARE